jgi:hypothetical protein
METINNLETKILQAGKYTATVMLREHLNSYPDCPYMVRTKELTPKGKYQKEKIIKQIVFKTEIEAEIYAKNWINKVQVNLDTKEKEKQDKKKANEAVKASDFYKVDDIVVNSWGWEQTNIDFYKVTKVGNKTISLIRVNGEMVENSMLSHGMACEMMPTLDLAANGENYNLRVYANGYLSNPASYYYFHKWSGNAEYCSWYA